MLTEAAELVEAAARDGALQGDQLASAIGATIGVLRVLAVTWAEDVGRAEPYVVPLSGRVGQARAREILGLPDDLSPVPDALAREDAARDVAYAWEVLRHDEVPPDLGLALDRLGKVHGVAVPLRPGERP